MHADAHIRRMLYFTICRALDGHPPGGVQVVWEANEGVAAQLLVLIRLRFMQVGILILCTRLLSWWMERCAAVCLDHVPFRTRLGARLQHSPVSHLRGHQRQVLGRNNLISVDVLRRNGSSMSCCLPVASSKPSDPAVPTYIASDEALAANHARLVILLADLCANAHARAARWACAQRGRARPGLRRQLHPLNCDGEARKGAVSRKSLYANASWDCNWGRSTKQHLPQNSCMSCTMKAGPPTTQPWGIPRKAHTPHRQLVVQAL